VVNFGLRNRQNDGSRQATKHAKLGDQRQSFKKSGLTLASLRLCANKDFGFSRAKHAKLAKAPPLSPAFILPWRPLPFDFAAQGGEPCRTTLFARDDSFRIRISSRKGAKAQSFEFATKKNPVTKTPNLASLRLCEKQSSRIRTHLSPSRQD
jgi:hypothetical protein